MLSDVADGVMTITLNRPDAANAVRPDDRDALITLLASADADDEVRVVVLRANGKHFCAGADVGSLADRRATVEKRVMDPMRRIMNGAQKLVAGVLDCNKPVIAAVQGAATGLGAHLVYASPIWWWPPRMPTLPNLSSNVVWSSTAAAAICCRAGSACRRPRRWHSSASDSPPLRRWHWAW